MQDGNIILSVAKAMELLQLLSSAGKELSLKELSAQCGYPKSTVFGLLTTMRAYGVVAQTPEGRYSLGLRLFEYGCQVERSWDISRVARPYMAHLSQQTGASVMLSICEGSTVITLDQVEARDKLRIVSDAGARLPIYCTSQGKVFLAHRPPQEAERLLRQLTMTQFTPHTITDVQLLLQELAQCRANGYAIENGEYKIGLRSISAPVYTVDGSAAYAVGVIGMFRSAHSEEFQSAIGAVRSTAAMISAALGYQKQEESIWATQQQSLPSATSAAAGSGRTPAARLCAACWRMRAFPSSIPPSFRMKRLASAASFAAAPTKSASA